MNDVLQIEHLYKQFGTHAVLNDFCLQVPKHSIFGFLGQNGAGKTTTMKMIVGLLKPDAGSIAVCGESVMYGDNKTNRYIGYLPDVPEFYKDMRPLEYLQLCANISVRYDKKKAEELLNLVGLNGIKKRISGFSRGMKQRLGIAQALLNEPKLLICDEPTSALDPIGRKEILDILWQVKGKTTVLFSTHILSDVERICDHIAILHNGKIALQGELEQLKQQHSRSGIRVQFSSFQEQKKLIQQLKQFPLQLQEERTADSIVLYTDNMPALQTQLFYMLSQLQLYPVKIELLQPSLENLFLEVVQ